VVLQQPFGRTLLILLAIGLCGYAVWRVLDATLDPERHGTTPGALVTRIGNAIRGLVYGALGFEAFRLIRGLRGSGGDDAEAWTARLLALSFGPLAVGIAGAIVAAYGISEIVRSARGRQDAKVDCSSAPRSPEIRVRPQAAASRCCSSPGWWTAGGSSRSSPPGCWRTRSIKPCTPAAGASVLRCDARPGSPPRPPPPAGAARGARPD
jgi:hypothetical protein